MCSGSGSVVVTAYDSESGCPGSSPEWGLIYYEASITAQGLPEPSTLRGSTLGIRAAEHKGCNWGMQIDWWLQLCTVFGHSFSGISWHMPQKWSQFNCMTLSKGSAIRQYPLQFITLHPTSCPSGAPPCGVPSGRPTLWPVQKHKIFNLLWLWRVGSRCPYFTKVIGSFIDQCHPFRYFPGETMHVR